MKDILATILEFLFSQEQKEHPMPPHAEEGLLKKLKQVLHGSEANGTWQNKI